MIKFICFFLLLILSSNILAQSDKDIYTQAIKQNVITLSGSSFRDLWRSRGVSNKEIERKLASMAEATAICHEEQFKLFGEKYYTLLIKGLESGKQFDKAFDVAIEAITSDIDNGVLPKRSTSQKLQSFYLNVGKCSAKRLEDNGHKT